MQALRLVLRRWFLLGGPSLAALILVSGHCSAQVTPSTRSTAIAAATPAVLMPAASYSDFFVLPENVAGRVGESFYCLVTGAATGNVWGAGPYTSDSHLGTAAVHAGLVQPGETRVVSYTILAGQAGYRGSIRNGVRTGAWGAYPSCFRLNIAGIPAPGCDLTKYRGGQTRSIIVFVLGSTTGNLWGDGVYTDDSSLESAAVHAGLLKPNEPGFLEVEFLPGRDAYPPASRNGVNSQAYARWEGSFRLRSLARP